MEGRGGSLLIPGKVCAVAIDVGGTKTDVALVNRKGIVLDRVMVPTNVNYREFLSDVFNTVSILISNNTGLAIAGIGIGIAGQIEQGTGLLKFAPNLRWYDIPVLEDLCKGLNLSGIIINDVRAASWGEWIFGAGKGCRNMVCMMLGTGIGGGIVCNGRMLGGNTNTAGEIGHIVVKMNGRQCTCGNKGCMEAYSGGWAMATAAKKTLTKNPGISVVLQELCKGDLNQINAHTIAEALKKGDKLSENILNTSVKALIAGVTTIVNVLNPGKVVIGGGLAKGFPFIVDSIKEGVGQGALKSAMAKTEIVPSMLGENCGVAGAAAVVFQVLSGNNFHKELHHEEVCKIIV
jgi:glucokinase